MTSRGTRPRRKKGVTGRWSNTLAILVLATLAATIVAALVLGAIKHERWLEARRFPFPTPEWDSSWPALPSVEGAAIDDEVARVVYAFAARRPDVMRALPCFCDCQATGAQSHHDCYVSARGADGEVTEWSPQGLRCSVCADVTGDVMLRLYRGVPLEDIPRQLEREFGGRPVS